MKTIIAIDPGKSGGIAIQSGVSVVAGKMPDTDGDIVTILKDAHQVAVIGCWPIVCVMELVGGFTRAGGGQPGSAMFKFGDGNGFIRGVIMTLGIRVELVRPQAWQKEFSLGTAASCASKTAWKNKLKSEAERLFPEQKVTLATCDALLLLEYYRRKNP